MAGASVRYTVVADNDGHDYIIRADRVREWYDKFLGSDEYELGHVPGWALEFEGRLTFSEPSVNGEPVEV